MNVIALAGGVGGAKLADGLSQSLESGQLTVVANTGDDFRPFGLLVCPDLDTICYTLGDIASITTGWGRADETWSVMDTLEKLGAPTWFRLGDRDLGWHLERTRLLESGMSLSQVTQHFCQKFEVEPRVLPMTDQPVSTHVHSSIGELAFQEYFVLHECRPMVTGFHFEGIEAALPAPGVLEAINSADVVVICPSNPWVSIDPILGVPGLRELVSTKTVIGVSPIIAGKTLKGPAAKMFLEMGIEPSAISVARHYAGILGGFVVDTQDSQLKKAIEALGIEVRVENTVMKDRSDRSRLAARVLEFGQSLGRKK